MSVDFTPSMRDYKNTGTFKFWCQKVLPLVYDDSLSYYELLCKVVNYLNDVIQNADALDDNVRGLYNAYVQLQDYVNNYFDNLYVQNEINKKLDEMAESGVLSNILLDYFKSIGGITPYMFGAKGDSVTNDTLAFQTTINYAQENGVDIFVPKGDFAIYSTLTLNTSKIMSLRIYGVSPIYSVIRNMHDGFLFNINEENVTMQDLKLKNLTFINGSTGTSNGILLNRVNNYEIENCIFRKFIQSLKLVNCWCGIISDCIFTERYNYEGYPMLLIGGQCNSVLVNKCQFLNNSNLETAALFISDGQSNVTISNCNFEYGRGILIMPNNGRTNNLAILNCYFEWMSGYIIKFDPNENLEVYNTHISDCYLNGKDNTLTTAIILSSDKNTVIENCFAVRVTNNIITNSNFTSKNLTVKNISSLENTHILSGECHYEISALEQPTNTDVPIGTICWNISPNENTGWKLTRTGWVSF